MSNNRVSKQAFLVRDGKQSMNKPAITHIHLGRLYDSLTNIDMPGRETPHQHQVNKEIEVAADGFYIDTEVTGELSRVQQTALIVSQHDPETPQCFCGNSWTKLRDVSFKVSTDKILSPAQTLPGIRGKQTFREPARYPQVFGWKFAGLQYIKGG